MKISEAIQIQKDFIARKYHIFKYSNKKLIKSMKVLTLAYDDIWEYLLTNPDATLNDYLINHENKELQKLIEED